MKVTNNHVFFFSYKDALSNHFRCVNPFWLPKHQKVGAKFHTVEHFMMYEKAMLFGDTSIAVDIANAPNPQQAKLLGRKVKNFDNDKWEAFKISIVTSGLVAKMIANPGIMDMAVKFYLDGKTFVEASPYDKVWGIGMSEDDKDINNEDLWKGQNLLGKCWEGAIFKVIAGGHYQA